MPNIACPRCGTAVPYVAELAGRNVFCLGCGSHFALPALNATPSQEAASNLTPVVLDLSKSPTHLAGEGDDPKPIRDGKNINTTNTDKSRDL